MKRTFIQWLHLIFNLLLVDIVIFYMWFVNADQAKYARPCYVQELTETGHDYKGRHYTEYYISVIWQDRNKESETFEISGSTFVTMKKHEHSGFYRIQEKYEWMKQGYGMFLLMSLSMLWMFSGIWALKNTFKE